MTSTQPRVSKRDLINRVAARSGMSIKTVTEVYEALFAEVIDAVAGGESVVLTGIGRFYRQDHKGHKVRFGRQRVDDYSVLKFSASRGANRKLGVEPYEDDEEEEESEIQVRDSEVVAAG